MTDVVSDAPKTGSGAAWQKGQQSAVDEYNEALATFKKSSGFDDIMNKWGFDAEAARNATAKESSARSRAELETGPDLVMSNIFDYRSLILEGLQLTMLVTILGLLLDGGGRFHGGSGAALEALVLASPGVCVR